MAENPLTCTHSNPPGVIRESEVQFIADRIDLVKDFHGCLCYNFAAYTRKTGCVRDKGDKLAKILITYSDNEPFHQSMKQTLMDYAAVLAAVQDFRQKRIDRLEHKIIAALTKYEAICKSAKADIKYTLKSKRKKHKLSEWLSTLRKCPSGDKKIAKGKLYKASAEANKNTRAIKELVLEFEERKLLDLKKIMLNFVKIEMVFHAKALELYTTAWKTAKSLRVKADMKEFCNYLIMQSNLWKALDMETYLEHENNKDNIAQFPSNEENQNIIQSDESTLDDDEFLAIVDEFCRRYEMSKPPPCCSKCPHAMTNQDDVISSRMSKNDLTFEKTLTNNQDD